jgi:hypothetical protein
MAGGMMPGAGGMMQPMVQGGSGGFLRQAAATAAGIAGGALLFEGIQSMFGHHAGGILGNAAAQPGLSETVVNNYYGNDAASGGTPDLQTASYEPGGGADQGNWDQGNGDQGGGTDYANDPGYDSSQDIASDQDFGGDDLGSNDDFA